MMFDFGITRAVQQWDGLWQVELRGQWGVMTQFYMPKGGPVPAFGLGWWVRAGQWLGVQ